MSIERPNREKRDSTEIPRGLNESRQGTSHPETEQREKITWNPETRTLMVERITPLDQKLKYVSIALKEGDLTVSDTDTKVPYLREKITIQADTQQEAEDIRSRRNLSVMQAAQNLVVEAHYEPAEHRIQEITFGDDKNVTSITSISVSFGEGGGTLLTNVGDEGLIIDDTKTTLGGKPIEQIHKEGITNQQVHQQIELCVSDSSLITDYALQTTDGEITVQGTTGTTKAQSTRGDITVHQFDGEINAKTQDGNITVTDTHVRDNSSLQGNRINVTVTNERLFIDASAGGKVIKPPGYATRSDNIPLSNLDKRFHAWLNIPFPPTETTGYIGTYGLATNTLTLRAQGDLTIKRQEERNDT
jgi:hypothetical protein